MSSAARSVGIIRGKAKVIPSLTLSAIEEELALHIRVNGLPLPVREYRPIEGRMWRVDFAWVAQKVVAECEGGTWSNGRHNRGKGFEADCEKYNALAAAGWIVLRFTGGMVRKGIAIVKIGEALER